MAPGGHPLSSSGVETPHQAMLVYCHIVKEGESGISAEIVIAARQGQSIRMASRDASCYLHPRIIVSTGPGQDRSGRRGRIVPERCCRPVELHSVRTMHLIPEAQSSRSAGRGERLPDRAGTIGWYACTSFSAEAAAVRDCAD